MSPRRLSSQLPDRVAAEMQRGAVVLAGQIREARRARHWSVPELATRAGLSAAIVYRLEAGGRVSSEAATRVAVALGRRLEATLVDPRRGADSARDLSVDVVHSAMGEFEARRLRVHGFGIGIDEPYQHYQFAGRADLVAWDLDARALLHIENRTRFPNFQAMAGSFNAKCAYLSSALASRVGVFGWRSETHVVAGLWSAEVLHALRLRSSSFRSLCPDPTDAFERWWSGSPPRDATTRSLIVLDPLAVGRLGAWIGFDQALTSRPRHRGYSEAAARLTAA